MSLEKHIEAVKQSNPNATVSHFVDKDGYTVVKRVIKKNYKYNIDKLILNSPKKVKAKIDERLKKLAERNKIKIDCKKSVFIFSRGRLH